jgi:hypothetical protein
MTIKTIPLNRLKPDPKETPNESTDSGETLFVKSTDQRVAAIRSLDVGGDDSLIEELLVSDPRFQALVAKSKAGPRSCFRPRS